MRGGHANSCPRDGSQQLRARIKTLEEDNAALYANTKRQLSAKDAHIKALEEMLGLQADAWDLAAATLSEKRPFPFCIEGVRQRAEECRRTLAGKEE
jgi:hypothetical protein